MATENRRQFHRVEYPREVQPKVGLRLLDAPAGTTSTVAGLVIDCSERGVRIRLPAGADLAIGAAMAGTIRFPRGPVVPIVGTVVRVHDDAVALRMERAGGIPLRVIMDEQRYLRARFARSDE